MINVIYIYIYELLPVRHFQNVRDFSDILSLFEDYDQHLYSF